MVAVAIFTKGKNIPSQSQPSDPICCHSFQDIPPCILLSHSCYTPILRLLITFQVIRAKNMNDTRPLPSAAFCEVGGNARLHEHHLTDKWDSLYTIQTLIALHPPPFFLPLPDPSANGSITIIPNDHNY